MKICGMKKVQIHKKMLLKKNFKLHLKTLNFGSSLL